MEHIAAIAEETSSKVEQNIEERDLKTCENQELQEKDEPNQENKDQSEPQSDSSKGVKRTYISPSTDDVVGEQSPTKKPKRQPQFKYERVVFIDSTWNQTKNIVNDERLKSKLITSIHVMA